MVTHTFRLNAVFDGLIGSCFGSNMLTILEFFRFSFTPKTDYVKSNAHLG